MATQAERSATTRRRILEATVEALSTVGYGRTTVQEVQTRAEVSRGALLHHYPSRSELLVAAVLQVHVDWTGSLLALAQAPPPGAERDAWAVEQMWQTFQGPLYLASLELWLAARYDAELLDVLLPQERLVGQTIRALAEELFAPATVAHPAFGARFALMLDAMRGAAARQALRSTEGDARLLAEWTALVTGGLVATPGALH